MSLMEDEDERFEAREDTSGNGKPMGGREKDSGAHDEHVNSVVLRRVKNSTVTYT